MISAPLNNRAENIRIGAVVVAELKLRDVERQIFGADFVERANHATFEDRPKALNRVRVNRADNVLFDPVMHGLARIFLQAAIDLMFVRRQQTDFVRYGLAHELFNARLVYVFKYAGDHVALALHRADHRNFASARAAAFAVMALIPMPVVILAANPCFVDLDNAAELGFGLHHRRADFVGHIQRGFVRAKAHLPLNLKRANALFAGRHQMYDLEPLPKRFVRVLKDRACDVGKPIARALDRLTLIALPFESHGANRKNLGVAAAWAVHAVGPASGDQIPLAGIIISSREDGFKLGFGHLVNRLRTAGSHFRVFLNAGSTINPFSVPVKRQIIASWDAVCTGVTRLRLSQSGMHPPPRS
jgi:hypothetical protein